MCPTWVECGPAGCPPSALTPVHEWGWDGVPILAGRGQQPVTQPSWPVRTSWGQDQGLPRSQPQPEENGLCALPRFVRILCSKPPGSARLSHWLMVRDPGSGSTSHPPHPQRVMGLTRRPTLQTRTLMVQVALSHRLRLHSWARAELAFSLPTRSLRIMPSPGR